MLKKCIIEYTKIYLLRTSPSKYSNMSILKPVYFSTSWYMFLTSIDEATQSRNNTHYTTYYFVNLTINLFDY